jgi:hypothetical protein
MSTWVECPGGALVNIDRAVAIESRLHPTAPPDAGRREADRCNVFFIMPGGDAVLWRTFTGPTSLTDAAAGIRRLLAAAGVRLLTGAV